MTPDYLKQVNGEHNDRQMVALGGPQVSLSDAERALQELVSVSHQSSSSSDISPDFEQSAKSSAVAELPLLSMEAKYRALVEQIPAVVFMVCLDKGIGEAYVTPQIEAALGFSQAEWLEDPVGWYQQIHPDDKMRWSVEAAEMFFTGKPLRSAYRVLARDGRVLWF